jgi:hypothetical protein
MEQSRSRDGWMVEEIRVFYETRRFITVFTRALH